jgi:hypothetical protein
VIYMVHMESSIPRPARAARLNRPPVWKILLIAALIPAALALAGCATPLPPPPPRTAEELAALLPSNQAAYLVVRAKGNEELLGGIGTGLMGKDAEQILSRTDRLSCAVLPVRGGKPDFTLALAGTYPASFIKFALSAGAGFKDAGTWFERKDGTQVAVPDESLLLVSDGKVAEALERATRYGPGRPELQASAGRPWSKETEAAPSIYPDDVLGAFRECDIALYAPDPSSRLFPAFLEDPPALPISRILTALKKSGSAYRGTIYFVMNSDREAKIFLPIVRLFAKKAIAMLLEGGSQAASAPQGGAAQTAPPAAPAGAAPQGTGPQASSEPAQAKPEAPPAEPSFTLSGKTIKVEGVAFETRALLSLGAAMSAQTPAQR